MYKLHYYYSPACLILIYFEVRINEILTTINHYILFGAKLLLKNSKFIHFLLLCMIYHTEILAILPNYV